jgi:hypothetical protein
VSSGSVLVEFDVSCKLPGSMVLRTMIVWACRSLRKVATRRCSSVQATRCPPTLRHRLPLRSRTPPGCL